MIDIDNVWLEKILKEDEAARRIDKVIDYKKEDAHGKGDSYGSEMSRITMEVTLTSGRTVKRSLIFKRLPTCKARADYLQKFRIFEREIKAAGYRLKDRREGLDVPHATLVVQTLARFHAMSAVLLERGQIDVADYAGNIFTSEPKLFQKLHNQGFRSMANAVEKTWGPDWQHCVDKLKNLKDLSVARLSEVLKWDSSKFTVLCHGDVWVTNMMFRYWPGSDKPTFVKFIDYQLAHLNSYAFDLHYFLTTSLNGDTQACFTDDLTVAYLEELRRCLRDYHYAGNNIPTMDTVKSELSRMDFFRVIIMCCHLSFMMADPEYVPDMDDVMKDYAETEDIKLDDRTYTGKKFTEVAKIIMSQLIENQTI